jgi:hypothetical protein
LKCSEKTNKFEQIVLKKSFYVFRVLNDKKLNDNVSNKSVL